MKILVVGTGGVGGYYGGLLAKAGHDVTFLARGKHYQEIRQTGLTIKSVVGDFKIYPAQVIATLAEANSPDLILFCVKTYDTEEVAKELASMVTKNTVIISLQNGIDNDQIIEKHVKESIVIPGIAYIISEKSAPGLIEQTAGPRTIVFGRRDKQHHEILDNIEKIMRDAGIEATHTDQIEKELWIKFLWIITFAGMTSLFRSSIGPIVSDPGTMDIYTRCLQEAFAVAQASRINVSQEEYESIMKKSEKYKQVGSDSKSSMLIDIEKSRPTEVESLHGTLYRLAEEAGVSVPINKIVYCAVRLTHKTPLSVH